MEPDLDRDYYREPIKYLTQFDKAFFVVGKYQLPKTPSEVIFCCFTNIYPVAFGVKTKCLCDHIHINRTSCQRWHGRFTYRDVGKKFLICVRPRVYQGNRGGLELDEKLQQYILPIAPMEWYSSKRQIFSAVPYDKTIDFRFLPSNRYWYVQEITGMDKVGFITKRPVQSLPHPHIRCGMDGEPPHHTEYKRLKSKIQRLEALGHSKSGRRILDASQGITFDIRDKNAYLTWLLGEILDNGNTPEEGENLIAVTSIGKKSFERLTGVSRSEWCQMHLAKNTAETT